MHQRLGETLAEYHRELQLPVRSGPSQHRLVFRNVYMEPHDKLFVAREGALNVNLPLGV